MAKVSVVIPTIGRPDYILGAIRSALAQTFKDLEVLVSDNGSPVSTEQLCLKNGIHDSRLKFIVQDERLEFSEHLNLCVREARGHFTMILSDDDEIDRDYVQEMYSAFEQHSNISVAMGLQVTDVKEISQEKTTPASHRVIPREDFLSDYFLRSSSLGLWTYVSLFARRNDIIEAGAFPPYPRGCHSDNFLLLRLLEKGDVSIAPARLFYRVHESSTGLSTHPRDLVQATFLFQQDVHQALLSNEGQWSEACLHSTLAATRNSNVQLILSRVGSHAGRSRRYPRRLKQLCRVARRKFGRL